ncbi:hypothetical protein MKW98_005853 [Papaver atlanticum]|uniref:Uncharacterized protein n=1 Tax=Papaver atlanticum TaxID=357466 RepID=A0AAD4TAT1_9MAGN|nr:hypothetical protein MKW98_005853 [Papaver atlanticum]
MAGTRSLIIAVVFVWALVASNILMCTATKWILRLIVFSSCLWINSEVNFECSVFQIPGVVTKSPAVIVGSCHTPTACDALCSRIMPSGRVITGKGNRGDCGPDDEAEQKLACACC